MIAGGADPKFVFYPGMDAIIMARKIWSPVFVCDKCFAAYPELARTFGENGPVGYCGDCLAEWYEATGQGSLDAATAALAWPRAKR